MMNTDDMTYILFHVLPAMQNGFAIRARDNDTYFHVDPKKPYVQAFIAGIEQDLVRRIEGARKNHVNRLVPS